MPRRFAIAAALATVLAVSACGAAAPLGGGAQQQTAEQSSESSAQSADSSAQSADSSAESADSSGEAAEMDSDANTLRTATADASLRADPGNPGLPAGSGASVDDVLRLGAVATWVDAPNVLAVSLPASSDCWPAAGNPMVTSATELSIAFAVPDGCEEADAARTYEFEVPDGVDASAELVISLEGLPLHFTLTLPAG